MDSTHAIREAIQFIQWSIYHDYIKMGDLENANDESVHCESSDIENMQEVIRQLQRLPQAGGSNYGTLWSIDDLRIYRPAWNDATLTKWFSTEGNHLSNRQSEDGFATIRELLEIDGMCQGCSEDSADAVCAKCEDDHEITVCIKCTHVMRREHLDDDICQVCS